MIANAIFDFRIVNLTILVVLLSFSNYHFVSANIFSDIVGSACGAFVTGLKTGKCYDEFLDNYKELKDKDDGIPEYVACCGVSIMQSCLEDQVAEICGEEARGTAKSLVSTFVKTSSALTNQPLDCDWDAWYYDRKSPVCWPIWAQAFAGFVLLILLFGSVASCICGICCGSRRRRTTYGPVKARA